MKRKQVYFAIRLLLAISLLLFIGYKINNQSFWAEVGELELTNSSIIYLLIALCLMPVNWGLEAYKWQIVMRSLRQFSFGGALKSVLAGISTGLITPNRIGNFIGRTYQLEKGIKTRATFLTFLTNLAQYITTVSFGLIGLYFFGVKTLGVNPILIGTISVGLLLIAFYAYFNPGVVYIKKVHNWYSSRVLDGIQHVKSSPIDRKVKVLLLSQIRYCVFILQYALILHAFNVEFGVSQLMIPVMVVYFIMTITPALFFGKLIVREASALLVFSSLGMATSTILISGFVLWFVNLALPSIMGAVFLFRKK